MKTSLFAKPATCFCLAITVALTCTSGVIGQESKAKTKGEARAKAPKLVDLNTATAEELEQLPGVGKATSKKIIDGRPYTSVDDLAKAGISASEIDKIQSLVTVSRAAARASAAPGDPPTTIHRGPVDLNNADAKELQTLPGIGPALAEGIVKQRPYASFADLERVKGLGKAKIEALNGRVKFGSPEAHPTDKDASAPSAKTKPSRTERSSPSTTASVPSADRSTTPKQESLTPGKKININTAKKETLDALPGIGPVKAQAIIEARPFKTIEDIKKVKGIKDFEFDKIKDMITVQ
jgi:competence protein ComEA